MNSLSVLLAVFLLVLASASFEEEIELRDYVRAMAIARTATRLKNERAQRDRAIAALQQRVKKLEEKVNKQTQRIEILGGEEMEVGDYVRAKAVARTATRLKNERAQRDRAIA